MSHPDLETPLGRAWYDATSVEHALRSPSVEADDRLKYELARLAHAVKVLAELIERLMIERR